jgi:hypothetical protein
MMDNLPQKYMTGVWLLHGLLNEGLGQSETAAKDFQNSRKYDPSSATFLDKGEPLSFVIFPPMNRLCTLFPHVELRFPGHPVLVLQLVHCE